MKNTITKKQYLPIIDYIKAFCVALVIITHSSLSSTQKQHPLFVFVVLMAVPVFMILSGYTFSLSSERHTSSFLSNYSISQILPKILRFTVPVLFAFSLFIYISHIQGEIYTSSKIVRLFLLGIFGNGSYYYALLLQLIFIFPLIQLIIKKNLWLGLFMAAFFNVSFEIFVKLISLDPRYYRILIFRYFLLIAFGCAIYYHHEKIKAYVLIASLLIGVFYIIAIHYLSYVPKIFTLWTSTSMMTAFYVFPICYLCLTRCATFKIPGFLGSFIALAGKASYHIFLVQMVYFGTNQIKNINHLYQVNDIRVLVNLVICISLGILFYWIEKKVRDAIKNGTS